MLFNSFAFFIFFPIVTTIYWLLPSRFRWIHLLAASVYFYMWFVPWYILILVLTIVVDYSAGRLLSQPDRGKRKFWLIASVWVTILILGYFKYSNFFINNVRDLAELIHWNLPLQTLAIVLPVGLSFHTFQSLSYVIEVYRGDQKPERHFGLYALYVMFYPQLVAGPIERPQNLLHQFHETKKFDLNNLRAGLFLMAWGFCKKIAIADNLAVLVNRIYPETAIRSPTLNFFATVFFAVQIYCDFSGYSDIARGSAKTMGFDLMVNFRRPYFARTVGEFWRRWHISLSTWFKDYVYIPLGGSLSGRWKIKRNLLVTFLLSGLWHGANWTYLAWGFLNGLYLVVGRKFLLEQWIDRAITFVLIWITWIYFRAETIKQAHQVFFKAINGPREIIQHFIARNGKDFLNGEMRSLGLSLLDLKIFVYMTVFLFCIECWEEVFAQDFSKTTERKWFVRWPIYLLLLGLILGFGRYEQSKFIYFQF